MYTISSVVVATESGLAEIGVALWIALFCLGLLVCVLWIILPFAVFGIKRRLDQANLHLAQQTEILLQLRGMKVDQFSRSYDAAPELPPLPERNPDD